MAYRDDILIRLGIDPRGFDRGLKGAQSRASRFARSIGLTFAAGGMLASIKSVTRLADEISTMSATIGTSTDFLQGWQSANEKFGVAATKSTMGLQRFSRRLAEAVNGTGELRTDLDKLGIRYKNADGSARKMEDVLYDYIDAIASTTSEQEKLRLAFKAFDSEGAQMVATLKNGSSEIKKLIEGADKLTERQIEQLARAETNLAKFGRTLKVALGSTIGFLTDFVPSFYGALSAGATVKEARDIANGVSEVQKETLRQQIHRLTKEEEETRKAAEEKKRIKDEIFRESMQEEDVALQKMREQEELRLDVLKEQLKTKKQIVEQDRASAFRDMSSFTIEELAGVEGWLSGKAFQQRRAAQYSLWLQKEAKRARLWGADEEADKILQRSLDVRGGISALSDSDRNPFLRMDESMASMQADMKELLERAKTYGININPVNGQ